MASISREIILSAPAAEVWDAVRDFGALHRRLVPGFVTDAKMDGDARIVTFVNGSVARELLVDCDDRKQRLVYAVVNDRVKHYNAIVQVIDNISGGSKLMWTIDLLPNEIAPYIGAQMDQAATAMQSAFAKKSA